MSGDLGFVLRDLRLQYETMLNSMQISKAGDLYNTSALYETVQTSSTGGSGRRAISTLYVKEVR
jgi:hypothetical protein